MAPNNQISTKLAQNSKGADGGRDGESEWVNESEHQAWGREKGRWVISQEPLASL